MVITCSKDGRHKSSILSDLEEAGKLQRLSVLFSDTSAFTTRVWLEYISTRGINYRYR